MSLIKAGSERPLRLTFGLVVVLAGVLAACGRDEAPPPQAPADPTAETEQQAVERAEQEQAIQDQLATLSPEELRAAATEAYGESRLYSPAGENALEYYLSLRDQQPDDAGVASALTDLLPMTVIATEQSRDREDYEEARRLLALIERASEDHPALSRLTASIDEAEEATGRRIAQQQLSAEQEAERQRLLQEERIRQQQQQQQEEAARALAAQEEAEREAAERQAAEQAAAAQRAAEQRAAEERRQEEERAAALAAAAAAAPRAPEVRAISTPAPRYPPDALRSGQGGEVLVEFTINPDGSVSNARVVRADPPRVFDREAVNAVRRWRFEPVAEAVTTRRSIGFSPEG